MAEKIITTIKCGWGCGKQAQYYFPYSKKYCCGNNVSKCPSKNRKMVETRKSNGSYLSGSIKGLQTKQSIIQKNGKTILQNAGIKGGKTKTTISKDGTTMAKQAAKKMVATRKSKINETTGLDLCKSSGLKQKITKDNDIDINGLNMHQRIGKISKQTNLKNGLYEYFRSEDFKNTMKKAGVKLAEKRKNDIDESGLDHYARIKLKMLEDIDKTGLNAIERAHRKSIKASSRKQYKNTNIHYQCSYELDFLEKIELKYNLKWLENNVKNGIYIKYWNPISLAFRYYIPDFIINNTLYEIKSKYTWNKHGKDKNLENVNKAKLNAAKENGYIVMLILDKEEVLWN